MFRRTFGCNFSPIVLVAIKWRTFGDRTKTWWPYPLLTQTNGYFLKKAIWRGKPRKLSPPLIINYLVQSVNDRDGSLRLRWPK